MTPFPTTPCVDWTGAIDRFGYGRRSKPIALAHRWAYTQVHGPIPDGMVVMHLCDRPSCVNVEHLVAGSQRDNMQMAYERGSVRGFVDRAGELNNKAKLTAEQVREIRAAWPGHAQSALAARFGVSQMAISKIVRRVNWKHVV